MSTVKKTTKALVTEPSEESVALVSNAFPVDSGFTSVMLPRLGMVSQDKFEGKGKNATLVKEAGMFFIEKSTDEKDEADKAIWEHTELGTEVEVKIIYQRKQLRHYDEATETFTSSPIYDNDDEIVPLFANKAEVERGTPAELKQHYMGFDRNGKAKSQLEDNRVLYVLYQGPEDEEEQLYQMNLRGSSMFSFMNYSRKARPSVPSVLTKLSSSAEENGAVSWNKMQFEAVRPLTQEEINMVAENQRELIDGINERKASFAERDARDAAFAGHQSMPQLAEGKE